MEDGDENCKMSMSEKLALFNKLSLPEKMVGGHADAPPERRRQKGARYRTQPITVEEVSLVSNVNTQCKQHNVKFVFLLLASSSNFLSFLI